MILSIIVAMASDRAIGGGGKLLWHLPSDLKRFKALTSGHPILMGRKTFESLPCGALPKRRNIVISRKVNQIEGVEVFPSIEDELDVLSEEAEVFVIGGGEIYASLLKRADRLYLTEVEALFPDADTHFPSIDEAEWEEVGREEYGPDAQHAYGYLYRELKRKEL